MKCLKHAALIFLTLSIEHALSQQLKINSNIPPFLVQGDHIEFKVELSNNSDSELTGQVQLELTDSMNQQSVDGWLMNTFPNQYFTIAAGKKETVSFPIQIPPQFNRILKWRCTAHTGSNADTTINHRIYEEGILPVLTNRVEKSESYSLIINDTSTHQLLIKKLSTSGNNETFENKLLQIEVSCNPAIFAVVGMPTIMHQNSQLTNRLSESFFATCVLSSLNEPTFLKVNDKQLHEELKNILSAIKDRQMKNGAFPWIASESEDLKTTIEFLTLAGQLKYLHTIPERFKNESDNIIKLALQYVDDQINKMISTHRFTIKSWSRYFYMRSFYPEIKEDGLSNKRKMVLNAINNPKLLLNKTDLYRLLIYLVRSGETTQLKTLESKIDYQTLNNLTVEELTFLLEAYQEMHVNKGKTSQIIKSILQQRKENGWSDAASTLSAFYSFSLVQPATKPCEPLIHLQTGPIHLYNTKTVESNPISYYRKVIDGSFVKPEMALVSISVQNTQQLPDKKAYATIYWSYINESEKEKTVNNLKIKKTITGNHSPINYPTVQIGDTILIKLELSSDKDYDQVELIDLPPAGFSPVIESFTSGSVFNNHYYFYIKQLRKGRNVLEYQAIATHTGAFNFGTTELEVPDCHVKIQYASPEIITIE
jgi:uncharacterized protein YfaS (alpha-2-macroglobulin family)